MSYKYELKWGIVMALALFLFQWILKLGGYHDERIGQHYILTIFGWLIVAGAIAAGIIEKRRKELEDIISYWGAVRTGTLITVISLPFQSLFTWLLVTLISPEFFENAIEAGLDQGGNRKHLESYFNLTSYLFQTLVGGMALGFVFSLIIAIVVKKK